MPHITTNHGITYTYDIYYPFSVNSQYLKMSGVDRQLVCAFQIKN